MTEITAVPGCGELALLPADGDPPPPLDELPDEEDDEEDEEEEEDEDVADEEVPSPSLSCCENGSLLAKRLKEDSCPSATGGADASDPLGEGVDGVSPPPSDGAARMGVPVVVVAAGFSL